MLLSEDLCKEESIVICKINLMKYQITMNQTPNVAMGQPFNFFQKSLLNYFHLSTTYILLYKKLFC